MFIESRFSFCMKNYNSPNFNVLNTTSDVVAFFGKEKGQLIVSILKNQGFNLFD